MARLASLVWLVAGALAWSQAPVTGEPRLGRLPVAFVPNLGQWAGAASYAARFGAMTVFLEDRGWTFTVSGPERGVAVRMRFVGAGGPRLEPEARLPGVHHYFLGKDPARWRSDVPLYGAVRYEGLYPGVDVKAWESGRHFEYDVLLAPGADLERVEIAVEGAEALRIEASGALVIDTAAGPVRMGRPPAFETTTGGGRAPVACRYVLRGPRSFGFEARGRDAARPLLIDPGLVYATYLGGAGFEEVNAVALAGNGVAIVVGATSSVDYPTVAGALAPSFNGSGGPGGPPGYPGDVFVSALSPQGDALLYSTYLGGSWFETAYAVAFDAGGVTIAGYTNSDDFPVTPGAAFPNYHAAPGLWSDAFVTRIAPSGASLVYSTYLGGTESDAATCLAVEPDGTATVGGSTAAPGFPTTPGCFDATFGGGAYTPDGFLTRWSPSGALTYSTFLGGSGNDVVRSLALDVNGDVVLTGTTASGDFPTTPGAFDTTWNFGIDAFVTRISPFAGGLVFSTFIGGSWNDLAHAVALDPFGAITVAGSTASADFPTTPGCFDPTYHGPPGANEEGDAFVLRLTPGGDSLIFSTHIGSTSYDAAYAVAVEPGGDVIVAGRTYSPGYPVSPGAFGSVYVSGSPAPGFTYGMGFLTRLSSVGVPFYSTFLGGSSGEQVRAIALDAMGDAVVAGWTESADFPVSATAFDASRSGVRDGFVARLTMLPLGVSAFGSSSPGCLGPHAIGVTSMPQVGNASFAITCNNAPAFTSGLLVLGPSALTPPASIYGVNQWVSFAGAVFLGVSSNVLGVTSVPLPIPNSAALAGVQGFAQFGWQSPISPLCPALGFSASNALAITVQP